MDPLRKLAHPPYVHNFVRLVGSGIKETQKNIIAFHDAKISYTYAAASPIILDRLRFNLDRDQILRAAANSKPPRSAGIVADYVEAFVNYDEEARLSSANCVLDDVSPYRAGSRFSIPVKPLAILVENAKMNPLFSFAWAKFDLSVFQIRLMMTIIEDAVFTLEDYRYSAGRFLCFPKEKLPNGEVKRSANFWTRGDYELLSRVELQESLETYSIALKGARSVVAERPLAEEQRKPAKESHDPNQKSMFD